jgi:hypothetical protein
VTPRLVASVCGALVLAGPVTAWAQRVEVSVAAPESAAAELDRSLTELFERVELQGRVVRVARVRRSDVRVGAPEPDVVARVWIDASRRDRCTVIVADPRVDRLLVRRVPLARGLDEIAREAVAHIVQDTVDALRRGQRIGVPREEGITAVDEDAPVVAPTLPSRAGFGVTLGWAVQPWATPLRVAQGPELRAAWWIDRRGRFAITVDAGMRLPMTWDEGAVAMTALPVTLRVGAGYEAALGARWALGAFAGVGVDAVWVTPRANGASAVAEAATVDVRPVLRARVELAWAAGRRVRVSAGLLADVDVTETAYYVERGGGRDVVASPWAVRPGVVLGVTWDGRGP